MKTESPHPQHLSEHLDAERTFLAWVRTNIAIVGLGFVMAKFEIWLRELASHLDPKAVNHGSGISLPLGVGMMVLGAVLTLLAAWHFHHVNRAIDCGFVAPNRVLILTVTAGIVFVAMFMIASMILAEKSI
jgi:putative membrane protein